MQHSIVVKPWVLYSDHSQNLQSCTLIFMLVAFYGHPCMLKLCSVVKYFCEESVLVLTTNLTLILDYSHFHLHVSDFLWSPNPCMIKLYIYLCTESVLILYLVPFWCFWFVCLFVITKPNFNPWPHPAFCILQYDKRVQVLYLVTSSNFM